MEKPDAINPVRSGEEYPENGSPPANGPDVGTEVPAEPKLLDGIEDDFL